MKKAFLLICFALVSTGVFAQTTFNVKAGMNVSNFLNDDNAKAKVGFKGGVGADIRMSDILYLQPTLYFAMKGAHYDTYTSSSALGSVDIDMDVNSSYLELPILVTAKLYLGGNTNFFVGVGPYIAYGIGGRTRVSGSASVNIPWLNVNAGNSDSWDTFGSDSNMRRFDAGIGAAAGFEFGKFIVGLDTMFGLVDVINMENFDNNSKNVTFSVGIGYKF